MFNNQENTIAWVDNNAYPKPKIKQPLYNNFFVKYVILDTILTIMAVLLYTIIK